MYISCYSANEWLKTLKSRYNFDKTHINDSKESILVFYLPNYPKESNRMLIGSYNKQKKTGVIICRRNQNKVVEFDRRGS